MRSWRESASFLATSRCGSLSDHSRTGTLAVARCQARSVTTQEHEG
ncbi:hypothetical protein A2U01_0085441, partial [Trifolium medium]|nr:hypothetical protein [Trifolium medium]